MTTSTADQLEKTTWQVSRLRPNQKNPRELLNETGIEELAASIRAQGILQPLLITPLGVVVAGHRRLAAAKLAGLEIVPVIVRDLSHVEQLEIMLVENLQREDLSVLEEARAYKRLLDSGITTANVARRIGVTTSRVNSRVQLLRLDEQVQWMFHRGDLPLTLAYVLARITDPARQRQVATMAARRQLTVPELERIVDRGAGKLSSPPPPKPTMPAAEPGDRGGPTTTSPGRAAVLEQLEAGADRSVSLTQVGRLFRDVCCSCGMQDLPEYCAACPMVQLVEAVLTQVRTEDAPRVH